jgi:hypothetical protein
VTYEHPDGRVLKVSPEIVARTRANQEASQSWQTYREAMVQRNQSLSVRALITLRNRLRGNSTPDTTILKRWADEVATRLQLTPEAVLALWRPLLVKRGLRSRAGRPRIERRHQLVLDLMAAHDVGPADRMPRGFWAEAIEAITEAEGDGAPVEAQSIRQWWIDHKPACPSCLSAQPTRQKA